MGRKPKIKVTRHGTFRTDPEHREMTKAAINAAAQIFKLQKPLVFTTKVPMCLAYNKDRTWQGQFPMTEALQPLFVHSPKVYILAVPQKDGKLQVLQMVEDQDW